MYLNIVESGETGTAEALTIDPASLYSAFEQVTGTAIDGGGQFGHLSHCLTGLSTLLILA